MLQKCEFWICSLRKNNKYKKIKGLVKCDKVYFLDDHAGAIIQS